MKFVIWSPRQGGGGPLVLHELCKTLIDLGYDARIFRGGRTESSSLWMNLCNWSEMYAKDSVKLLLMHMFPDSQFAKKRSMGYTYLPVRGCRRKWIPRVDADTVVVYPDIVAGNPLHAKHVVRWMLFYPQFQGKDWYAPSDLFFSYRTQFNDASLNPTCRLLHIFHFDSNLYRRTNYGERHGSCYFVRKGQKRPDLPKTFDGPVLDNLPEEEKVRILNQSERCYLYDTQTFYATVAAICGCVSIVVPEPGKRKEDYVKPEDDICGVAYGDSSDEIAFAMQTRDKITERLNHKLLGNKISVQNFVAECKDYFQLK